MLQNRPAPRAKLPRNALLVDDDSFMLTVIGDMLRDLGVQTITTASDGARGIQVYDRAAPELIVCDLNMPNNDGFQFMEQLAARDYRGGIILATGMDARTAHSASLMARFHRLHILATLTKPVEEAALRKAVAALA